MGRPVFLLFHRFLHRRPEQPLAYTFDMATIPDLRLEAGLPANIDAEKTILGAILLDNAAHAEASERLTGGRLLAGLASAHLPAHDAS